MRHPFQASQTPAHHSPNYRPEHGRKLSKRGGTPKPQVICTRRRLAQTVHDAVSCVGESIFTTHWTASHAMLQQQHILTFGRRLLALVLLFGGAFLDLISMGSFLALR